MLLVFSFIFTVVSRLLQVKDEKFLHIEGHSERFTELPGEEKMEGVVRGNWNEMR